MKLKKINRQLALYRVTVDFCVSGRTIASDASPGIGIFPASMPPSKNTLLCWISFS